MKFVYTITNMRCPVCGTIMKKKNDAWIHLLVMCLFPIWIIIIPYIISYFIMKIKIFKVLIPPVGEPKIKICPTCGSHIQVNTKVRYDTLDNAEKLQYDNRWWFRLAYFLGGSLILSTLLGFLVLSPYSEDQTAGTIFLCLASIFLVSIVGIVYRWKKLLSPSIHKSKKTKNMSVTDELKKYKELLDSGIITQEEFDIKKKQLLDL